MRLSDKAYQIISPKVKRSKVLLGYKICRYKSLCEKKPTGMYVYTYVFGEAEKVHLDCKKSAAFPIACGRPVHIYQNISE
jgi:hypothetical protein